MKRIVYILLGSTLIFHVVRTTYVLNVQEQKIQSIYAVLARIQAAERAQGKANYEALKRDAVQGLDIMLKTYPAPPHASQEFIDRIQNQK
jgi:hypothetical protein